ncbi:MAG TPA: hypothetical protein VGH40_13760 [Roseiarcus sp.]|jgi:hypothetical protein
MNHAFRLAVAATALAIAGGADAQQAVPSAAIRATIESVADGGGSLVVHRRSGETATIRLKPDAKVTLVVPASLADVKPGLFVGVAAVPGKDGALNAMEVHIFPEAMRGVGEGFRPFDLAPGSTMTNGAIEARVDGVAGPKLTVTYRGGQQAIDIPPSTPIVGLTLGARSDLKPGAAIVARGAKSADGTYEAGYVLVGKNGLTPPM